jgi:tetratricopeptide (TPR) repeat protein
VRYVLEGSVRRAGERLRITGQLIDALSGTHIWAERFDGTLSDVFDLQDRVAEGVAGAIEPTLRGVEIERARRKPTESLDAYDFYLRALPHLLTPTPENNREALRLLERALVLDPSYAVALGLKAWCHLNAYLRSWAGDDDGERMAGEQAARRALVAGQDDPAALASGGFVVALLAHDHEAGLAALGRAVALNANSALAFGASALVNCFAGHYDVAIEHGERALRLSPLDPLSNRPLIALAYAHLFTGRHHAAAKYAERAVHANPGFDVAHALLVASLVELGRLQEARAAALRLMAAFPAFRVSRRRRAGFRDTARFESYLAALRQAGLPD